MNAYNKETDTVTYKGQIVNKSTSIDFSIIQPIQTLSKKDTFNKLIKYTLLNKKSGKVRLCGSFFKEDYVNKNNLLELFNNILFYTQHLNTDSFKENLFLFLNNIKEKPICPNCKKSTKFRQTHYTKYCSQSCANQISLLAHPFSKESQIKNGKKHKGKIVSEETKRKQSIKALSKEVQDKKKATNFKRYGVENPGVLGAKSSKIGEKFILRFLDQECIDIDQCYFSSKYFNKKEFYQMVFNPILNKKSYFSYDLVVFETIRDAEKCNLDKIKLVLEYNGFLHHRLEELTDNSCNDPSTPYSNNKYTKYESWLLDKVKLDHMLQYTENINIFWEDFKILKKYIGDSLWLNKENNYWRTINEKLL